MTRALSVLVGLAAPAGLAAFALAQDDLARSAPPAAATVATPTSDRPDDGACAAWLARRQSDDGSFGSAPAHRFQLTALALATLATRKDDRSLDDSRRRAAAFLMTFQDDAGAFRDGDQDRTVLALFALVAYRDGGSRELLTGLRTLLDRALAHPSGVPTLSEVLVPGPELDRELALACWELMPRSVK